MRRPTAAALAAVMTVGVTACGVTTENEPELITTPSPVSTPTMSRRPEPSPAVAPDRTSGSRQVRQGCPRRE